jgi:hypothetical protein
MPAALGHGAGKPIKQMAAFYETPLRPQKPLAVNVIGGS